MDPRELALFSRVFHLPAEITITSVDLCWLLMISAEQIASFPHQLLACSRLICSMSEALVMF